MVSKIRLGVVPSVRDGGVQNLGVEVAGGILSRPVSPKLVHEAVLAKPPYFETPHAEQVSPATAGRL